MKTRTKKKDIEMYHLGNAYDLAHEIRYSRCEGESIAGLKTIKYSLNNAFPPKIDQKNPQPIARKLAAMALQRIEFVLSGKTEFRYTIEGILADIEHCYRSPDIIIKGAQTAPLVHKNSK